MTELQRRAGRGLLIAMVEVDPAHLVEFTQWYETEHLADRQRFPGFLTARRYINVEGGPRAFFARYDIASPKVLNTPAYKKIATSPWTEWMKKFFPRPGIRQVFVELGPKSAAGKADRKNMQRSDTRGLFVVSVEIKPDFRKQFQGWVEKICLPAAQSCKGVLSARFFKDTSGNDGHFLLLYDLKSQEVAKSSDFKKLPGITPDFCASPAQLSLYREIVPKIG